MRQRIKPLLAVATALLLGLGAVAARAQEDPVGTGDDPVLPIDTTSTSTPDPAPSSSTTSTTKPAATQDDPDDLGDEGSTPAPEGAGTGQDGDGVAPGGHIVVPPEAQRIINSVVRSGPSNNRELVAGAKRLEKAGLTSEEAIRVSFGRFIIAGPASYTHDWLYPRYGPGFRFHLGTDVFAARGTPVRAPVDGFAQSGTGDLGGLFVKVFMDDGTYFYMAHLSGLVEGFKENMPVKTGDIVGYVGDSGNAKGGSPHVHLGIYPQGGPAVDPKPILDRFLVDAVTRLPEVIAFYEQEAGVKAAPARVASDPSLRPLLATALLRPLTSRVDPPGQLPTEVLFASSANPAGGGLQIAEAEVSTAAASIDWEEHQFIEEIRLDVLARSESLLRLSLGPFVGPAERDRIAVLAVRGG